jgi:hypothetical protein
MKALSIHAGPRAMKALREHGLRPRDVQLIPAAAGGPKGLILSPLDQLIFGRWLVSSAHTVHLLGASVGAWRMATACLPDPAAAFAQMAQDYIDQEYPHPPGRLPTSAQVTEVFSGKLAERFGGREAELLNHPRFRLHLFTSRGRHLLGREGRWRTPLGYMCAVAANALSRPALGGWLERVVFSDPRDPLPLSLSGYRTASAHLSEQNLRQALLASCSVPFAMNAVHDIPGGPPGAYWDGGLTDYHLHLDYTDVAPGLAGPSPDLPTATEQTMVSPSTAHSGGAGLVLYPHFQNEVIPGWLDKPFKRRHRATPALDNVVLLSPRADWVAALPNAKLPDRGDFKHYMDEPAARRAVWRQVLAESERLRDEFAAWLEHADARGVTPLR